MCLRSFISPGVAKTDRFIERRQYHEGIAVSHFALDGSRETGNTQIPDAETWLILGDSHVEAIQVRDEATMGSVIERLARANKHALNVKQYGWSQIAAPMYIAESEELLAKWNPTNVIVTLNRGDLGAEPLQTALHWRMEIQPDLSVKLKGVNDDTNASSSRFRVWLRERGLTPSMLLRSAGQQSSLVQSLVNRGQEIALNEQYESSDDAAAARDERTPLVAPASVRGLKAAYGDRLWIVYLPHNVGAVGGERPDDVESSLLDSCRAESVRCLSVREAMIRERDDEHRLSRGFVNTAPNFGHLNETGHRVVAAELWREVSEK